MSYSGNTTGIAKIEVTSPTAVTVTKRVKSVGGAVAWLVHNNTNLPVYVCVTNFVPAKGEAFDAVFLLERKECTRTLSSDGKDVIFATFSAAAGTIFTYDVTINGTVATDPELEI